MREYSSTIFATRGSPTWQNRYALSFFLKEAMEVADRTLSGSSRLLNMFLVFFMFLAKVVEHVFSVWDIRIFDCLDYAA